MPVPLFSNYEFIFVADNGPRAIYMHAVVLRSCLVTLGVEQYDLGDTTPIHNTSQEWYGSLLMIFCYC